MRYLPHTPEEIAEMLRTIDKGSLDELFASIPEPARFTGRLAVKDALGEAELMTHLGELASKNGAATMLSFLGAGMYAHHIPPAVDQLLLRSEFYTAYTPYQPEVAQGTLQAIWEFQTMVSEIYGLPLANASMYDGASASAEAAQMARRLTQRNRILVSGCVHPHYRQVIRTYLSGGDSSYVEVAAGPDGCADIGALAGALDDDTAGILVGYPAFCGGVADLRPLSELAHARGALLVVSNTEPYALALLEPPGALGADIAAGEGQPLACPPQFGGPALGLFACREERKYLQQLPGRICGETVDVNGQRGYVLTLSTREQHIRRDRATSNICTNQGLLALGLAIRMSLLGKSGFIRVGEQCLAKARYLCERVVALQGYAPGFAPVPCFNEFAVRVRGGSAEAVCRSLETQGMLAGLNLGRVEPAWSDRLLIAVTENHRRSDLDRFVEALDNF
ncbi:MAG TPA: aminomethyl-transferring glycine dehydrogenase subunit GcvPA [Polyangiaceae bacterium]